MRPFRPCTRPTSLILRHRQVSPRPLLLSLLPCRYQHFASLSEPPIQVSRRRRPFRIWLAYLATGSFMTMALLKTFVKIEVQEMEIGDEIDDEIEDEYDDEEIDLPEILNYEDSQSGTFFPLTFPKQLPTEFYKQSDPDWQEFAKLSKNPERGKEVRKKLAEIVTQTAAVGPNAQMMFGETIHLSRYWLDFIFPDAHPPEYIRRGLYYHEDYGLLLIHQKIPHSEYVRLNHIIKPIAFFKAARDAIGLLSRVESGKLKTYMGFQLSKQEQKAQTVYRMFHVQASRRMIEMQNEERQEMSRQAQREENARKYGGGSLQATSSAKVDGGSNDDPNRKKGWNLQDMDLSVPLYIPAVPLPLSFVLAMHVFRGSLQVNLQHARLDHTPKGCLYIFGNVEVVGTKRKAKLEVLAAYDPKSERYVYVSSKIKHHWELQQWPKGGK